MSHKTSLKASMSRRLKQGMLVAALAVVNLAAHAQGAGKVAAGIAKAQQEFTSYKQPIQQLLYAIAAIIALIGAFNVFAKMQNGDQDVKKTIMMVVGGCVALIAMAQALPLMFT